MIHLFSTYIKLIINLLLDATGFLKSIWSMSDMSKRMLLAYGASSNMRGRIGLFMFTAYPISRMTLIEAFEFSELMKITAFDTSMASTISSL